VSEYKTGDWNDMRCEEKLYFYAFAKQMFSEWTQSHRCTNINQRFTKAHLYNMDGYMNEQCKTLNTITLGKWPWVDNLTFWKGTNNLSWAMRHNKSLSDSLSLSTNSNSLLVPLRGSYWSKTMKNIVSPK